MKPTRDTNVLFLLPEGTGTGNGNLFHKNAHLLQSRAHLHHLRFSSVLGPHLSWPIVCASWNYVGNMSPSMCRFSCLCLLPAFSCIFLSDRRGRHRAKTKLNANENCFRFRGGWDTALGSLLLLIALWTSSHWFGEIALKIIEVTVLFTIFLKANTCCVCILPVLVFFNFIIYKL